MRSKKLLFIMITGLQVVSGFCFDIRSDFQKLNGHYAGLKSYSMNFEVIYESAGLGNLAIQKGRVLHTEDVHYTELAGNITLISRDEFVTVNVSSRLIVYNQSVQAKTAQESRPEDVSAMIDSLWANQQGYSYRYLQAEKGQRKVYIEDRLNDYYSGYSLTVDAGDFRLLEFVYYVKPDANQEVSKVIIRYSGETARPKVNRPEYKTSYYVRSSGGELQPAGPYQNFRVIDQTKVRYETN